MTTLLLSRDELVELSGYKRPGDQSRWLGSQGIRYFVGADGRPRVLRDALLQSNDPPRRPTPALRLPK